MYGTVLWQALGKLLWVAGVMGLAVAGADWGLRGWLPAGPLLAALRVAGAGGLGVLVYFALAAVLRVGEVRLVLGLLRRRLKV